MKLDFTHEPPTADEMLAYLRGGLSAEEEANFRSRVIDYPELVRTLVADFPEPAQPQDADYLSDEEFARRWDDFQKRIDSSGTAVPFWRMVAAVAATVAVVFATMYWKVRADQQTPQVLSADAQPLYPDSSSRGLGGSNAITIAPAGDSYLLAPVLRDDRVFDSYRLELFDDRAERVVWSKSGIQRNAAAPLLIVVPRSFVRPGVYRLSVSGVAGGREQHLNDYTIRLAP